MYSTCYCCCHFFLRLDKINPKDAKDTIKQSQQLLQKWSSLSSGAGQLNDLDLSDFELNDDENDVFDGHGNTEKI